VDYQLGNVTVLFDVDDDVCPGVATVKDVLQLLKVIFYVLSNSGRDFNVATSVLKPHLRLPSQPS
jgi:hypothetical protein